MFGWNLWIAMLNYKNDYFTLCIFLLNLMFMFIKCNSLIGKGESNDAIIDKSIKIHCYFLYLTPYKIQIKHKSKIQHKFFQIHENIQNTLVWSTNLLEKEKWLWKTTNVQAKQNYSYSFSIITWNMPFDSLSIFFPTFQPAIDNSTTKQISSMEIYTIINGSIFINFKTELIITKQKGIRKRNPWNLYKSS